MDINKKLKKYHNNLLDRIGADEVDGHFVMFYPSYEEVVNDLRYISNLINVKLINTNETEIRRGDFFTYLEEFLNREYRGLEHLNVSVYLMKTIHDKVYGIFSELVSCISVNRDINSDTILLLNV